jgi:hypothetical protein
MMIGGEFDAIFGFEKGGRCTAVDQGQIAGAGY